MSDTIDNLQAAVSERLQRCGSEAEIEQLRIDVLGRKGQLTLLLRGLKDLPVEERPKAGERLNQLRRQLEEELEARLAEARQAARARVLEQEAVDVTLPGTRRERGRTHPLTLIIDEIVDVFRGMGFEVARGPDIEDDYHNFEALNIPKDHPARDMQDTFFLTSGQLLRTHTSPVQIRTMEIRKFSPADIQSGDRCALSSELFSVH
jgi:phenylalanyl-tRNA synthetase alpha chain